MSCPRNGVALFHVQGWTLISKAMYIIREQRLEVTRMTTIREEHTRGRPLLGMEVFKVVSKVTSEKYGPTFAYGIVVISWSLNKQNWLNSQVYPDRATAWVNMMWLLRNGRLF